MASSRSLVMAVALALTAVLVVQADPSAPPSSPPSETCSDTLISLLPCVPAVQKNATAPTPECCSALKAVTPTCICYLVSAKPDIPDPLKDINLDAVAKLPKECGLNAHYV